MLPPYIYVVPGHNKDRDRAVAEGASLNRAGIGHLAAVLEESSRFPFRLGLLCLHYRLRPRARWLERRIALPPTYRKRRAMRLRSQNSTILKKADTVGRSNIRAGVCSGFRTHGDDLRSCRPIASVSLPKSPQSWNRARTGSFSDLHNTRKKCVNSRAQVSSGSESFSRSELHESKRGRFRLRDHKAVARAGRRVRVPGQERRGTSRAGGPRKRACRRIGPPRPRRRQ